MDELLLSKIRLGVIAELLNAEWVAFSELQRATQTTNGNLGAHLGKLVEAGYVSEEKTFMNRRPQTRYRLSKTGRAAFVQHVRDMQRLLEKEQAGSSP
ncbi:MAG TPA: transcriptional regulator [Candidatus Rubrimentiphilum sp.]|nr:transcriptional regulator [Candidatus Rubrimentiphilum sp.]